MFRAHLFCAFPEFNELCVSCLVQMASTVSAARLGDVTDRGARVSNSSGVEPPTKLEQATELHRMIKEFFSDVPFLGPYDPNTMAVDAKADKQLCARWLPHLEQTIQLMEHSAHMLTVGHRSLVNNRLNMPLRAQGAVPFERQAKVKSLDAIA